MAGGSLGIKPNDLQAMTLDLETFLEQDILPAASASPAQEFEPTSDAVAMFLTLLDLVFIDFGTLASVLRDLECVIGDFL